MKPDVLRELRIYILLLVFTVAGLSSCRTTRDLPTAKLKPISTNRLLKKVEKNAFDFNHLTIKRINCRFSGSKTNANFRVQLKAKKDEKILISISKINIPVGRLLLTPDSVIYVNYLDRNFFVDDYSFLSSFLNIDLDFETIQSIISNNVFSYRDDTRNRDFRTFETSAEEGLYLLQSEKERKMKKLQEANEKRVNRRLKRFDDEALIHQKMYFNPRNFTLSKLIIDDKTNNRNLQMDFSNFEKVQNHHYPGTIEMTVNSPEETIQLKIRMNGFSTQKIDEINLRIPGKYEQIDVN